MRVLLGFIFAGFLAFSSSAFAYECKSFDSKCKDAVGKAELTQSIFKILDAGIRADWDARSVRDLFTAEEKRELKKLGLDVNNAAVVRALKKTYDEKFSHLDSNAWQSILDTLLHEKYVETQVIHRQMNTSIIERLTQELERSGKKVVKSKSGNFFTKSSARTAVVILEDMKKAQESMLNKLAKADTSLEIDVLAEVLGKSTLILVDRNAPIAKKLSNPKEFEKLVLKTSHASGVAPLTVVKKMQVAAAPALQVMQQTAQAQINATPQGAAMSAKKVKRVQSASANNSAADDSLGSVIIVSSLDDSVVISPQLPSDISSLSVQELRNIYADATDEDHKQLMAEYARYANLTKTDALSREVWEQDEPGYIYGSLIEEMWDRGYQGIVTATAIAEMDHETAEFWQTFKDLQARTERVDYLLTREIEVENERKALGSDEISEEENLLEELHWQESHAMLDVIERLTTNATGAILLSNDQLKLLNDTYNKAFDLLDITLSSSMISNFRHKADNNINDTFNKFIEEMEMQEQGLLWGKQGSEVMALVSVANELKKEVEQLTADGKLKQAKLLDNEASDYAADAFRKLMGMSLDSNTKTTHFLPAINYYVEYIQEYYPHALGPNSYGFAKTIENMYDLAGGMVKHQREIQLAAEDAATAAQQIEFNKEIQNIQNAINNLGDVADDLRSQGASEGDISAYIADQQAQMQAGMQELCNSGDPNVSC